MAPGDGWTSRLLTGLAEHIAVAGIGDWHADGSKYTADQVGILIRRISPDPDRIITLAPYPVSSPPGLSDVTQGIQLRLRGTQDPRVAEDLGDDLFDLLDSAEHYELGGIHVVQSYRQSYASLGSDTAGRFELSHNYYFEAMRPTPNRTI